MKTWLMIDVPCLAHRALHTTGDLENGVAFGVLAELRRLLDRFRPAGCAFAFDSAYSERVEASPEYKRARREDYKEMTLGEKEAKLGMSEQLRHLRAVWLPELGHANVFIARGYEADDVLASLVQRSLSPADAAVVVSSDKDLHQLLEGERVVMWKPHKKALYSEADLRRDFGVHPSRWAECLALAGDPDDGVAGMEGVGYKTAAGFFAGTLRQKKLDKIGPAVPPYLLRNLPLVRLPYAGCPTFPLSPDNASVKKWRAVCKRLGFNSLLEA